MSAIISRPTRQKGPKMQKACFKRNCHLFERAYVSDWKWIGNKILAKVFQNNVESTDLLPIHDLDDQDDDEEKVNR